MKWLGLSATKLSHTTKLIGSKLAKKSDNTQLFYIMCYVALFIMFIPIFIRQTDDYFTSYKPLTKMERIWILLVIIFCITVVVGGVLLFFTKDLGFYLMLFGIIGGFIMNMIMMVLCCSHFNAT